MKIKLSIFVILFLIQIQVFAQSTWQTAQAISHNSTTSITSTSTDYWFTFVAQNVIEANQQYVNEVYLSSFAQKKYFTESQGQTLYTIAMLTPYIGGDAVYSARVMLGINPNTYQLPYRKGHFNDTSIAISYDNTVLVYPNPAKSQLTVEFLHALETTDVFTLYDITGRKVMEQTLNSGTLKLNINVSGLDNGVYFYTVKSENKAEGKIIINN